MVVQSAWRDTILDRLRGGVRKLTVRIPSELHREVDVHCARRGSTMQEFVTSALREKLDREEGSGEEIAPEEH